MDVQSLLCGLNSNRSRNSTQTRKDKSRKAKRKHLPKPTGEFSVGCVDIVTEYDTEGIFMRLFYPTNATDIIKHEESWPQWLPSKMYAKGYVHFRRQDTKLYRKVFNFFGGSVYCPTLWQGPIFHDNHGAGAERKFPVLVWSHGLGGNRTCCSTLCAEIASHGFIIAVLEHREGSASMTMCLRQPVSNNNRGEERDNRSDDGAATAENQGKGHANGTATEVKSEQNGSAKVNGHPKGNSEFKGKRKVLENGNILEWMLYPTPEDEEDFNLRNGQVKLRLKELQHTLDILEQLNAGDPNVQNLLDDKFDLQQFQGRLDLTKIAATGHSFGATAAMALAGCDPRIKCCLAYDAWMMPLDKEMYMDLPCPLLMLNTEKFGWYENMKPMVENCKPNEEGSNVTMITVSETCHQSFCDFGFLVPKQVGKYLWLSDELSPKQAMKIVSQGGLGFLNKNLDIPDAPLHEDILTAQHELVMMGTNVDITTPPKKKK